MREFLAIDRCDRCGAQASHAAFKPGYSNLLFCTHHYHKHKNALLSKYWLIESKMLDEPQPVSAFTES